ncbi:MAG: hypothetical protein ABIQ18_30850 [Umezawaea sp.]
MQINKFAKRVQVFSSANRCQHSEDDHEKGKRIAVRHRDTAIASAITRGGAMNEAQLPRSRTIRRWVFVVSVLVILGAMQTEAPILLFRNILPESGAMSLAETIRTATPGVLVALLVTYLYERSKDAMYARRDSSAAFAIAATVSAMLKKRRCAPL